MEKLMKANHKMLMALSSERGLDVSYMSNSSITLANRRGSYMQSKRMDQNEIESFLFNERVEGCKILFISI